MARQNYSNHIRYYTPHHFIFYPLVLIAAIVSFCFMNRYPEQSLLWGAMGCLLILTGWLSFMMRQHYALAIQNRVVRLELRLRYFQLTGQRLEEVETQLSIKQIAALRFAGDEELPILVARAAREKLLPDAIKRAITNWQPDTMRV